MTPTSPTGCLSGAALPDFNTTRGIRLTEAADTVSALAAEYISLLGTKAVFGYPGTSNIEFMESCRRRGVDVLMARREATAAFMAEGYSLATGDLGVCITTLGPGSTSVVQGVAAAQLDRVPMLAISGQIGSSREPYFTHQVVDHGRMFAPVTKWAGRVEPMSAGIIFRKAIRTALAERPGAVHLTINDDLARAEPDEQHATLPPLALAGGAGEAHLAGTELDELTRGARKPILLVGAAALRTGAGEEVTALSEAKTLPIVVAPMAKGVVSEDHPNFAGVLDMACNQVVWEFMAQADLILAVGFDPVELIKMWKVPAPVVHIDAVPNTDQIYQARVELVGHIPTLVRLVKDTVKESSWTSADIAGHRRQLRAAYYAGRVSGKLNPTDVVDTMRAASPRDAIMTTDVGSHKLLLGQGWTTYHPRTSLMSNGLSSMGFSLPGAIGAKLARPAAQVVSTMGDGGFAMVQSELSLASELGLGMTVVVFVDNSLNRIELKQRALNYPSTATRLSPTDIPKLAEAMGCDGVQVSDTTGLEKAFSDGRGRDRPFVIAVEISSDQYQAQF